MEIQGLLQTKLYRGDGMQPFSQKANYWPSQQAILSVALLLLAAFLFSGCSEIKPTEIGAPEDTAVGYVREMNMGYFDINDDSVEAIQKIELNNYILVLVQYLGTRHGNGVETCQLVLETGKDKNIHWNTGSGMCHKINDPTETQPITEGSTRGGSSLQNPGYSTVYGMIRDSQITKIVITWEDGQIQPVEVQKTAYMAAREGGMDIKKAEAFNDQNELVYTTDHRE